MYMPFGRHIGEPLADLPVGYLAWLLTIDLHRYPRLRPAVEEEMQRRRGGPGPRAAPNGASSAGTTVAWDQVISKWFSRLSLKFHPDRGGSHEHMVALNVAREELEKILKELG
jgi:hypothetical protein